MSISTFPISDVTSAEAQEISEPVSGRKESEDLAPPSGFLIDTGLYRIESQDNPKSNEIPAVDESDPEDRARRYRRSTVRRRVFKVRLSE